MKPTTPTAARRPTLSPTHRAVLTFLVLALTQAVNAQNLPTGGKVVQGEVRIAQPGTRSLDIYQTSPRAVIEWDRFNIGLARLVTFFQPDKASVVLNRVVGSAPSVIEGILNANGHVYLVNPNGLTFTRGASVNTGSLVASTQDISNANFMAGKTTFSGRSTASITQRTDISVPDGGTVALIAANIINTGSITANQGQVLMGAGNAVTLDLGGPVKLQVQEGALNTLIQQGGAIRADGGLVYLTTRAVGALGSSVINHTGITQARTLATGAKGQIVLQADMQVGVATVGGSLDTQGATASLGGGSIHLRGAAVQFAPEAQALTSKVDPDQDVLTITTSKDFRLTSAASGVVGGSLENGNVTIRTVATQGTGFSGDIYIEAPLTWRANTQLTLSSKRDIRILNAVEAGTGKVALEYGQGLPDTNNTARYDFGLDFASEGFAGSIGLSPGMNFSTKLGANGSTLRYQVITTPDELQNLDWQPTTLLVLGRSIDLPKPVEESNGESSVTYNFVPNYRNYQEMFEYTVDGLGHSINNMYMDFRQSRRHYIGLFGGLIDSTVRNLGIKDFFLAGSQFGGILAGQAGTVNIQDVYASGTMTDITVAGGLFGTVSAGTINHVMTRVNISGGDITGGLSAKADSDDLFNVSNRLDVSASRTAGNLTGAQKSGGLVGELSGMSFITTSQASGNISAGTAGGLIASQPDLWNRISNSYFSGKLAGNVRGGIVGWLPASEKTTLSNTYVTNYFDSEAAGTPYPIGAMRYPEKYYEILPGASHSIERIRYKDEPQKTGMGISLSSSGMRSLASFGAWGLQGKNGALPTLQYSGNGRWAWTMKGEGLNEFAVLDALPVTYLPDSIRRSTQAFPKSQELNDIHVSGLPLSAPITGRIRLTATDQSAD